MTATAPNLLSRKLRLGGVARPPLPDVEIIGEAFARRVEDRLRPLVKTIVTAVAGPTRVGKLAEAAGAIVVPALIGVVEVEDADTPGLLSGEAEFAYHLIDLILGGDPAAATPPRVRPFTAIDMALCRPVLEAILSAFTGAIGEGLGRPPAKSVTIRDQRQTLAQLRLAPDYIDVLTFEVILTLGEAGRTGRFALVLPLSALDVIRASVRSLDARAAKDRRDDPWKLMMRRAAAVAPVPVTAVLHRQSLSLAALRDLAVGQVIEIPANAPAEIALTIDQPGGRPARIATAELGAYRGAKVVKVTGEPDPRLRRHVAGALGPDPAPEPEAETASTPPAFVPAQSAS
jgi:flagellar motor switch protein FliM